MNFYNKITSLTYFFAQQSYFNLVFKLRSIKITFIKDISK